MVPPVQRRAVTARLSTRAHRSGQDQQVNGLDVMLYYWDEPLGLRTSGWLVFSCVMRNNGGVCTCL